MERIGVEFRIRGMVQGVGFRPTVWRLARAFDLTGHVLNDGAGVLVHAWGAHEQIAGFVDELRNAPPPLARIESIERSALACSPPPADFRILTSECGAISTGVAADAATCPACLADVFDPVNRRFGYAFTNCTHCGPRLSIVHSIPYDRSGTSMAQFQMCDDCRAEYDDPGDRRFHAEPIACPKCGPTLWLEGQAGEVSGCGDPLAVTAQLIRDGAIVAIKGIGGFHLACDARNAAAVSQLRMRKQRYHKPFALMARDPEMVEQYALLSPSEQNLLLGPASPIVVSERRQDGPPLADEVAPSQSTLGFMLPYTPLHHMLVRHLDFPIVLTSGNTSDEPQCIDNGDARVRLSGIADYWLMHDRAIVNRLDDSVVRIVDGQPVLLRRARGYAPEQIAMPEGFPSMPRVLALGGELKSTFCIVANGNAVLSQHLGDLEDAAANVDYRAAVALYRKLYKFEPEIIAVDQHPGYLSTQWGGTLASDTGARLVPVQHHHAHIAAVLAEHGVALSAPQALGIVLDGLGLGEGGELWGGEFLRADYRGCKRLASFAPIPLVGGSRAMKEPWRNAFSHLNEALGWQMVANRYAELDIVRLIESKQPAVLTRMVTEGINAPRASSAGRLFDAIAAVLGICAERVSYEGQAAIELETLAGASMDDCGSGYCFDTATTGEGLLRLSWRPFWSEVLADLERGTAPGLVAARAHAGVINAVSCVAERLCAAHGISMVVLSGGVFQNKLLTEGVTRALRAQGLNLLLPHRIPSNDGGISFGQAVLSCLRA